jgi:SAM-dependent methyltransferase
MKRYRAIAEYYDAENDHQPMLREDVPFFLGQLPRRQRQTVLELAVGTARAAIPIAQAGHRVVGVDYAADMLEIARRKRDAVGLRERDLPLVHGDILELDLKRRFDWVCVLFNTFLSFTTLEQQDRAMQAIVRHLKPAGRLWLDVFNPDPAILARPTAVGMDPHAFFVPRYGTTVLKTTEVRRNWDAGPQVQRVTFKYTWFDDHGRRHRRQTQFDLTYIFPRELRLLVERHGLRVERMFGNYDASPVRADSPRLIARCCRK